MPLIHIDSLDDPRVADYLHIREAELRRDRFDAPGGLFVAEGELVFRRLLASRFPTRSVLLTPTRLATVADALDLLPPSVPVFSVPQRLMNDIVGFNIHRGILAIGERGPEPDPSPLLHHAACAVVLEDLVNHDNVGAIFRNTAALAGIQSPGTPTSTSGAILLSPRCCDPLYRKSIRVSMGWALAVPWTRLPDWPAPLAAARAAGYRIVALHPSPDSLPIAELERQLLAHPAKVALVVGTEGAGLSAEALAFADLAVHIPMRGYPAVDSLNVAVATAIALDRIAATFPR